MLRTHSLGRIVSIVLLAGGWVLWEDPARAATPKRSETKLDQLAFFRPDLAMASSHVPLDEVLARLPNQDAWRRFLAADALRPASQRAQVYIDPRSGVASNILAPFPLIPGRGVGNRVTLAELAARKTEPPRAIWLRGSKRRPSPQRTSALAHNADVIHGKPADRFWRNCDLQACSTAYLLSGGGTVHPNGRKAAPARQPVSSCRSRR